MPNYLRPSLLVPDFVFVLEVNDQCVALGQSVLQPPTVRSWDDLLGRDVFGFPKYTSPVVSENPVEIQYRYIIVLFSFCCLSK